MTKKRDPGVRVGGRSLAGSAVMLAMPENMDSRRGLRGVTLGIQPGNGKNRFLVATRQ